MYAHISEEFHNLEFACLIKSDDIKKRKAVETLAAWKYHARYYRNGGSFIEPRNNYYESNCKEIIEKISGELGDEEIRLIDMKE